MNLKKAKWVRRQVRAALREWPQITEDTSYDKRADGWRVAVGCKRHAYLRAKVLAKLMLADQRMWGTLR